MAIVRMAKERLESDTCTHTVMYSDTDVRKALTKILRGWLSCGVTSADETWSESDLRYSLAKVMTEDLYTKNATERIAVWAFKLALRKKYIIQSEANKNAYMFSEIIKSKSKWVGY